ncbi:hypothetical protein [Blastococcus sp. LR1]|uniref:hypothetical protein n=1 Tax=Blastococcus sp. LR1 TaxID=2877000 RepID=UPI001CCFEBCC|nr:hypothetical protein [Blastococcus sp. LR1]MCA0145635.1 hypothetical protein [Blastococcus sp. LR1]
MTEPSAQRPVPGPPRPGPAPTARPVAGAEPRATQAEWAQAAPGTSGGRLDGLEALPVAEHVAVFEAEHERLQRELGTIDPL